MRDNPHEAINKTTDGQHDVPKQTWATSLLNEVWNKPMHADLTAVHSKEDGVLDAKTGKLNLNAKDLYLTGMATGELNHKGFSNVADGNAEKAHLDNSERQRAEAARQAADASFEAMLSGRGKDLSFNQPDYKNDPFAAHQPLQPGRQLQWAA
jgi:hypothetical protein